jgi:hypothetical protein
MHSIEHHVKELAEQGFTRIEQGIDANSVGNMLSLVKGLYESLPPTAQDNVPYLNRGHSMIYNLQNKDIRFVHLMLRHPTLRAILMTALNDQWYRQIPADKPNYLLRSLLGRSGGPEPLPLHIDSFVPSSGSFSWSVQAAFVLEDQHSENGCTVAVPGSHRFDRYADQKNMKDAVPVVSKAGDIFIFDSRTWHGTTGNKSGKSRWSIIGTFGRWWLKQNYDIPRSIPGHIRSQLNSEELSIMGFCSIPPLDEYERIDIKGGYELLPKGLGEPR